MARWQAYARSMELHAESLAIAEAAGDVYQLTWMLAVQHLHQQRVVEAKIAEPPATIRAQ